jgi:hypothetical protein
MTHTTAPRIIPKIKRGDIVRVHYYTSYTAKEVGFSNDNLGPEDNIYNWHININTGGPIEDQTYLVTDVRGRELPLVSLVSSHGYNFDVWACFCSLVAVANYIEVSVP